jgi:STE24 endopeptidase
MDGSKRSSHGNAYFTGIDNLTRLDTKSSALVCFAAKASASNSCLREKALLIGSIIDTLLKGMEDKEVEAILAHELGHFHHQHIAVSTIVGTSFQIRCFSAMHSTLMSKNKAGWLGIGIMCPSGATVQ